MEENTQKESKETPVLSLDKTLPREIVGLIMDECQYHDAAHLAQTSKACLFAYKHWSESSKRRKIEENAGYDNQISDSDIFAGGINYAVVQRMEPPTANPQHHFFYRFKQVTRSFVPPELSHAFPPSVDDSYVIQLQRDGTIKIYTKYNPNEPLDNLALFVNRHGRYSIELAASSEPTSPYYKPKLRKL